MTFTELRALLLGFRAADRATRSRMLSLVPGLSEFIEEPASRWCLTIGNISGVVVCREADLPAHRAQFGADHPFALGEVITKRLD